MFGAVSEPSSTRRTSVPPPTLPPSIVSRPWTPFTLPPAFVPSGRAFEPTRTVSLPAPVSISVIVCDGFGTPMPPGTWKP